MHLLRNLNKIENGEIRRIKDASIVENLDIIKRTVRRAARVHGEGHTAAARVEEVSSEARGAVAVTIDEAAAARAAEEDIIIHVVEGITGSGTRTDKKHPVEEYSIL